MKKSCTNCKWYSKAQQTTVIHSDKENVCKTTDLHFCEDTQVYDYGQPVGKMKTPLKCLKPCGRWKKK